MDKKAIHLGARGVIDQVREYVRSQADTWRRVPNAALEADGRFGHEGELSAAYEQGIWRIVVPVSGYSGCNILVDLANGNMVDPVHFYKRGAFEPAEDLAVLSASLVLHRFDATAVVQRLIREADRPYAPWFDCAKQEAWRAAKRLEYGIDPLYSTTPKRRI